MENSSNAKWRTPSNCGGFNSFCKALLLIAFTVSQLNPKASAMAAMQRTSRQASATACASRWVYVRPRAIQSNTSVFTPHLSHSTRNRGTRNHTRCHGPHGRSLTSCSRQSW